MRILVVIWRKPFTASVYGLKNKIMEQNFWTANTIIEFVTVVQCFYWIIDLIACWNLSSQRRNRAFCHGFLFFRITIFEKFSLVSVINNKEYSTIITESNRLTNRLHNRVETRTESIVIKFAKCFRPSFLKLGREKSVTLSPLNLASQ